MDTHGSNVAFEEMMEKLQDIIEEEIEDNPDCLNECFFLSDGSNILNTLVSKLRTLFPRGQIPCKVNCD